MPFIDENPFNPTIEPSAFIVIVIIALVAFALADVNIPKTKTLP